MKEFFNHLKGNWIKYGLETGVVITGILIAFGLSEWADSRKDQSKTTELIISLQNELLQIHDYAFRRKSSVQNQIDLIRYVMTSSTIRMDSISKLSRNLFSTRDDTVYHEKHPIDYLATYIVSYEPRTGVYTTSLNDGSLGLLENLNINHSLSTIYTNNPEQFANIDGTEISINKSLRDHISTKYQKHFEGGSWDIGGRWDEATTYGFLKEISKDMKLKILFSEKIQLLRVKRGTLNGGMNQIELILQQLNRRD